MRVTESQWGSIELNCAQWGSLDVSGANWSSVGIIGAHFGDHWGSLVLSALTF